MRVSLLILLLLAMPVQAIEKCMTADGRTLYSDTPCPPGSKRIGGVEAAPPVDAETQQRLREEREQRERDQDRRAREEAAQREAQSRDAAAARESARRAEQDELLRRQTEALERLSHDYANPPAYVVPPVVLPPRPHPHPLPPKPPRPRADEEEKRYEMAPMPRKKAQ